MPHTIEPANSGRSKCRGCGQPISKGELRFGERLPNPFSDDSEMTLWFHTDCASLKRPESLAEVIDAEANDPVNQLENIKTLRTTAKFGIEYHRTQRIDGVERAPSGRAHCRSCQEMIGKDEWRIRLVFFEDGMFNAAGNIHLGCSEAYFETTDIMNRLRHFGGELSDADITEIKEHL